MIIKANILLDVIDDHISMVDVIAALLDQVFKDNSHIAKLIICDVKKVEEASWPQPEKKINVEPR